MMSGFTSGRFEFALECFCTAPQLHMNRAEKITPAAAEIRRNGYMFAICRYDEYNALDAAKFERVCENLAN